MSVLDTYIEGRPNLVEHLPLTDASGSVSPAHSGILTTSWGAGAVPGSTGFLTGDTRAVTFPAVANAYARITSHSSILFTGDFTVGSFIKLTTLPGSTGSLFGNAHIMVQLSNVGKLSANVYDSTGAQFTLTDLPGVTYAAGDTIGVMLRRKGDAIRLYVNGAVAFTGKVMMTNANRSSTSNWVFGNIGFDHKQAHGFLYSRALTLGEHREMCRLAGLSPGIDGVLDRTADTRGVAITGGPSVADAGSGMVMSLNEEHVVTSDGNVWHAGSYAAAKPGRTVGAIVPGTSTAQDLIAATSRLMLEVLNVWSVRRTSGDANYLQTSTGLLKNSNTGTTVGGVGGTPPAGTEFRSTMGAAVAAAYIHRWGGGSRDSWAYRFAKNVVDGVIANYYNDVASPNGFFGDGVAPNNYFSLTLLPEIYLALYPSLDTTTRNRWKTVIVAAAEHDRFYEKLWYLNGNLELGTVLVCELIYQITGDAAWRTEADWQYAWACAPTDQPGKGNWASQAHFGWYEVVTPTQADGRDGAGYFGERHFTTEAAGRDWNYCAEAATKCLRLWTLTEDIKYLRHANMLWNSVEGVGTTGVSRWTKNTTSSWTLDGLSDPIGTRIQNAAISHDNCIPFVISQTSSRTTGPNGTTLLGDAAGLVKSMHYTARNNYDGAGLVYRNVGDAMCQIIACDPSFPDLRLR